MMTDVAALVLLAWLLPVASFLLLAVVGPFRRLGRPAAWLSIACAAGSLAAAVSAWRLQAGVEEAAIRTWAWLPAPGGPLGTVGVMADADSTIMLCLVALVATLVQVYSMGYLHDEQPAALGRYYTYQSLFAFSMMGLVLAPNLLQLFICWELVGVCSYLLIGFYYQKPEAARAAMKAFWITKAGDVGLLIGIVLLWRATGTFDLVELEAMALAGAVPLAGLSVITFCLYLGAAGKSAQFPLHIWLPDAMEGPTPVSALIHAATMVTAGVYLLVRTEWLFALTPDVLVLVAWVGAFTALFAAVMACAQDDIKRVLAYSTVSQLGYMMTAIGAGFAAAGFFHLLTHGLFKALLFLGAGSVIHAVHSNDLPRMGGLARKLPQTAVVFLIGTLSLAGLPLFGGYLSKEEVLGAVWAGGLGGPFLLLMIVAFLTAFYMFRVVFLAFFGKAPEGRSDEPEAAGRVHEPGALMLFPLWVLAALSMVVGVYFTFVHPETEFASPAWLAPLAVSVAGAGILLAWLTYQRGVISPERLAASTGPLRAGAHARFWIDGVFEAVYRGALLGFARGVGWWDRYFVDGILNVVSAWTVMAGDRLRTIQTGRPQDYVYALAAGVFALILWARLVIG
jgi:NADH-quinone oxidoreductase subunit L